MALFAREASYGKAVTFFKIVRVFDCKIRDCSVKNTRVLIAFFLHYNGFFGD
jgi:hypothetical protein